MRDTGPLPLTGWDGEGEAAGAGDLQPDIISPPCTSVSSSTKWRCCHTSFPGLLSIPGAWSNTSCAEMAALSHDWKVGSIVTWRAWTVQAPGCTLEPEMCQPCRSPPGNKWRRPTPLSCFVISGANHWPGQSGAVQVIRSQRPYPPHTPSPMFFQEEFMTHSAQD